MQLASRSKNAFKINTVLLAYVSAAEKMDIHPTMMMIENEIPAHFLQEFALDARIHDRFETYGAKNEEEFIGYMQEGRYRGYTPNQYELMFVLDQLQCPYFDSKGKVHNSVVQEVW